MIILSLGSNLGDREAYLGTARRKLEEAVRAKLICTEVIKTEAIGFEGGEFLNQIVAFEGGEIYDERDNEGKKISETDRIIENKRRQEVESVVECAKIIDVSNEFEGKNGFRNEDKGEKGAIEDKGGKSFGNENRGVNGFGIECGAKDEKMRDMMETGELTPEDLLEICKRIEVELGRKEHEAEFLPQGGRKYEDRVIDIDILYFNDVIMDTPKLRIPHPQVYERPFVKELLMKLPKGVVPKNKCLSGIME